MKFLALTSFGIENLLADEIRSLGGNDIVVKPEGVYFTAELEKAYHISLWTRLASRILLELSENDANTKEDVYNAAKDINWGKVFVPTKTFAIDFVGKSKDIRNTQFGALLIKDAIIDQFSQKGMGRPNVDKYAAQIRFQARLLKNKLRIYLDFSGRSLFQRGYRSKTGAAPLKENLAAALVLRSGWLNDVTKPFIDPMCGSGTIVIEAASMALKRCPSISRENWGFDYWLDHDEKAWRMELKAAEESDSVSAENITLNINGYDNDPDVLETARDNIINAGLKAFINVSLKDAVDIDSNGATSGMILFNPPYGERIGSVPELVALYSKLGERFKSEFAGWRVGIFSAGFEMFKRLKLASFKRYKFKNGPLDCQLAMYRLDAKQVVIRDSSADFQSIENSSFANRLKKNLKGLKGWLKSEPSDAYRVYDADIPEFNVAVDVYGDSLVIQEYAPPKSIDEQKAEERLQEVLYFAPQVLNVSPEKVSVKVRRKQKGKNQYQSLAAKNQTFVVNEHGAKFKVNLWDYLDTGLFLDHRKTRQFVAKEAKNKRFLNLFCYTGSVSVQAALHGASEVTSVDMSNTYINWAKDNFALNKLSGSQYKFVQADCLWWLKESREEFDVIFVDPPSFSNSKRMEDTFDVQRDHVTLLENASRLLAEGGKIIFTNNKRNFKLDSDALEALGLSGENITYLTKDKDFERNKHIHNSWLVQRIEGNS